MRRVDGGGGANPPRIAGWDVYRRGARHRRTVDMKRPPRRREMPWLRRGGVLSPLSRDGSIPCTSTNTSNKTSRGTFVGPSLLPQEREHMSLLPTWQESRRSRRMGPPSARVSRSSKAGEFKCTSTCYGVYALRYHNQTTQPTIESSMGSTRAKHDSFGSTPTFMESFWAMKDVRLL